MEATQYTIDQQISKVLTVYIPHTNDGTIYNVWAYNDGGRAEAGFTGDAGDCVTRSIAIAAGKPYKEVYTDLQRLIKEYSETRRTKMAKKIAIGKGKGTTPRNGVHKDVFHDYILSLGFTWVPTMQVGKGCTVHLNNKELPKGTLIVSVSKHLTTMIDGVIYDTFNPQRESGRCVYGYYIKN